MSILINSRNFKMIFSVFMFLLFVPIVNFSNNGVELVNSTLSHTDRMDSSPASKIASNGGPDFGTPSIDPIDPVSNESVTVTVPINDTDGVKNVTLFWRYTYNNSMLFNTSIKDVKESVVEVDYTEFDAVGVGDGDYGTVDLDDDRYYGNYTYEANQDEVIIEIDLNVSKIKVQDNLTYVLIKSKNLNTGIWEIEQENGTDTGTNDLEFVTYSSTKLVAGYQIYAISYRIGPSPSGPEFDYLNIYREGEEEITAKWVIPAANEPTFVTYNITAFDKLDNSATSDIDTFLMDWAPSVKIVKPPLISTGDKDYPLNVTVTDPDGISTINDSDVIAYYRLERETEWNTVKLDYIVDFGNEALYEGTIPSSDFENLETTLNIVVKASDIVEGQKGREGSSDPLPVEIDTLHPRVTIIESNDVVMLHNLGNFTKTTSEIIINATFNDSAGISSVSIYYSIPNGTAPIKKTMINNTLMGSNIESTTFFAILPSANETTFVEYFFESTDFHGNVGTTSVNFYYADGSAPLLDKYLLYPSVISNITKANILFNASDFSGLITPSLWYSFDGGNTWNYTDAEEIDYTKLDYPETFTPDNLPFLIKDNGTSYLSLEVVRSGRVDIATLTLSLDHEQHTDLRVWLLIDDGRRFIIFDRESGSNKITRTINLLTLGLDQIDFTRANFTLEIQDFNDLYSGIITNFEIKLIHYTLPLGYQYLAKIPPANNDTTVLFYFTLTDNLDNTQNTNEESYYSDGLAPYISVQPISSPLDMFGGHSIRITADITDSGGVTGAEIYYRFSQIAVFEVIPFSFNWTSGLFYADIPIPTENGTLYYKIRAFDNSGLSSETPNYSISFSSGLEPIIVLEGVPYPSPLDMEDKNTIRIWANVTDDGNIANCTISYGFTNNTEEWTVEDMMFDEETGLYYFDVSVRKSSGNLTFIISATDNLGLTSETDPYTVEFENAGSTPGFPTEILLIGALLVIGGGGSIAAVVYLSKKGKLKLPERFTRGDTGTD